MNKVLMNMSRIGLISAGAILSILAVSSVAMQSVQAATINNQVSVGSTGSDVTQLQQFLSTNPMIYPAGIVSGYYGSLTKAAVKQFQAAYGIDQVGNVGPVTMAKINEIGASGLGLDITVPQIWNESTQVGSNNATVSFTTNKNTQTQVYYSTSPITANEATEQYQLPYVSGTLVSNSNFETSNSVNILGLQANTIYYYLARAIDASGNMSMTMPRSLQTN